MKITLSKDQSAELLKLGINLNKPSGCDVITLDDLFDLLPKWIKYRYKLLWLRIGIDRDEEKWYAVYYDNYDCDEADTWEMSDELIDCLYKLLKYLLEEKLAKL